MSGCNCNNNGNLTLLKGDKGDPGAAGPVITTGGAGGTVVLTVAQSGGTLVLDSGSGIAVTLPTATPGLTYDFVVVTTVGVANDTVTATGAVYTGGVISIEDGSAPLYFAPNGTTNNIITMNGTTQGGVAGTNFNLTCYIANKWVFSGTFIGATAPQITPFSG